MSAVAGFGGHAAGMATVQLVLVPLPLTASSTWRGVTPPGTVVT
jgi:hypothetical protein